MKSKVKIKARVGRVKAQGPAPSTAASTGSTPAPSPSRSLAGKRRGKASARTHTRHHPPHQTISQRVAKKLTQSRATNLSGSVVGVPGVPVAIPGPPTQEEIEASNPPGRLRKYLQPGEGREYDPDSPDTPEGRLSQFNLEDWHAPARDERGFHDPITVEFPPSVLEELATHANSGKFPLKKSVKQLIRVLVHEGLHILRRLDPMPDSHMNIIDLGNYLNAAAEITYGYDSVFTEGRHKAHKLKAIGAVNEARKLVHDLIVLAKRIPAEELRDKYKRSLEIEFKTLLTTGVNKVKTNVRKNVSERKRKRRHENGG